MATFRRTPSTAPRRKPSRSTRAASRSSRTSSAAPMSSTRPSSRGDTVKFGATVSLIDEDTEEKKVYQIVGDMEADVKSGKVSISSPIARALIGKRKGDSVQVNTPGGGKSYEIENLAFR